MKRIAVVLGLALLAVFTPFNVQAQSTVNRVTGPGTIDIAGSSNVNTEGQKYSYYAGLSGNTPAATPTDVAVLAGSATKTVKITRITLTVQATTGAIIDYRLMVRSGGTQSAVNTAFTVAAHGGPMDTNDPVSSVIANGLSGVYTSNPASSGTTVGIPVAWTVHAATPATGGVTVLEYVCNRPSKCLTLRGATQFLAVNGNGHTLATAEKFGISFEWTEE